jgi:D-alanyl-D-alanine carboxypeptidase/D-alanyl-D-alanine-endopeptidase (penicillin-binding protein 4)
MRALVVVLAAVGVLVAVRPLAAAARTEPVARARASQATTRAQRALDNELRKAIGEAGSRVSGAFVLDLDTGQPLFSLHPDASLLPASVEKIYTTATALLRFGPAATLTTSVLGRGVRGRLGTWYGTLYLRGGGDPTFGSWGFDRYWYGAGATIQQLAASLLDSAHIVAVRGRIVGDESYFDSLRGTPFSNYRRDLETEGLLSGLAYDAGFANLAQTTFQASPALFAAQQFAHALSAAGVAVPRWTQISQAPAPPGAQLLATVSSPPMSTLIKLTNTPSDNFFAEMLLKALGARFGGAGTTAAGAAVVRAQLASTFGVDPQLDDGSGLSRADRTTPRQVVSVLTDLVNNPDFVNSLAVSGETGTLKDEMRGTIAQGRCQAKTGTLSDAANLAGYCQAQDGHTLVFAFLLNATSDTSYTHLVEDEMAVALAGYNG